MVFPRFSTPGVPQKIPENWAKITKISKSFHLINCWKNASNWTMSHSTDVISLNNTHHTLAYMKFLNVKFEGALNRGNAVYHERNLTSYDIDQEIYRPNHE